MIEKTASLEDYIRNEVYELCGNEETKQLFFRRYRSDVLRPDAVALISYYIFTAFP